MNYRKAVVTHYHKIRGYKFPSIYADIIRSIKLRKLENVDNRNLIHVLSHCRKNVPYYRGILDFLNDIDLNVECAFDVLKHVPVLTKDLIRRNFENLQSKDLSERKWYYNTSGGSTGEPIRLIQDREYQDKNWGNTYLYYWLVDYDIGKEMVKLWGSERDILAGGEGIRNKITSFFWNVKLLNAFRMTPEKMRQYLHFLDSTQPDLVLAYAQSIYELALFAERHSIRVAPQRAIMTSAGTLYPFMREKIEEIFGCTVFNRYGSREVGDIACEHPNSGGLWVAPWGCHVEVVDENDNPVPPGTEGDILLTSLTNYAMPLIRYKIGDRGMLSSDSITPSGLQGQIIKKLSGRNVDMFKCRDGTLIDGEYFTHLLYFRDWVQKFQFVQKDFDVVSVNLVLSGNTLPESDVEEINRKIRILLGNGCRVEYNVLQDIPPSSSGKYRYTISEVLHTQQLSK